MKKGLKIIIGALLIAVAYNLFFIPYDLVPSGVNGIGALLNFKYGYEPALFILIANFMLIIIALLTLGHHKSKEYVWAGLLIPIFIFLTEKISDYILFDSLEQIVAVIVGACLTGIGYSLIYKEGQSVGGFDLIQDILNSASKYRSHFIIYAMETIILILAVFVLSFESAIYSLIVIYIIRYISSRTKIGISSSKTFYIITSEEEKVKDYIMNELNHDLTEFNVKGGYTNVKSKILMTAIDTKEYYHLKQGVLLIDPKAFISITDSYEVINKNVTIKENKKKKPKKAKN